MKIAFIFPGQGAQYIGMGKDLYDNFDIVRKIFDNTDRILNEEFVNLVFNGTDEDIKRTENTQPGILMVSTAISELLQNEGIHPVMTAGLSLGEYSALVTAKSLSYEDALLLVRKRGRLMNDAFPAGKGGMTAVLGLESEKLLKCCEQASEYGVVTIANHNCPGQLVLSGEASAVEAASRYAVEAGAKRVMPLPVGGPFHSPLLISAGEALAEELEKIPIRIPEIPVVSNVTAQPVGSEEEIRKRLAQQVSSPVRWEDSIRYMLSQGVDTFIETGPGKALTGFMKRIDKTATVYNLQDMASLEEVLDSILAGLEGRV
ncbi:MAG: ACP S-malonyltransferase [Caldicoprobacterales bacterium]|jgi:[acyl-carrier-protein] S-malonyltransferase|nr:ACP S-malonyltransferase [Clostridiales bacterium]